jgi:RNA 2',3'-cyclic 3'-phosphodiesterase
MRLFTGISLPFEVRRNLELLLQYLEPQAAIAWSPADNWHITTKFIGEWPETALPRITAALRGMPKPAAFAVDVSGLGWFPNPHSPRVFFAGVRPSDALAQLAAGTQEALAAVDVPREERPYSPHLTLARVRTAVDLLPLKRAVAGLPSAAFGRIEVRKFNLYLSQPDGHASVYSVLEEFAL